MVYFVWCSVLKHARKRERNSEKKTTQQEMFGSPAFNPFLKNQSATEHAGKNSKYGVNPIVETYYNKQQVYDDALAQVALQVAKFEEFSRSHQEAVLTEYVHSRSLLFAVQEANATRTAEVASEKKVASVLCLAIFLLVGFAVGIGCGALWSTVGCGKNKKIAFCNDTNLTHFQCEKQFTFGAGLIIESVDIVLGVLPWSGDFPGYFRQGYGVMLGTWLIGKSIAAWPARNGTGQLFKGIQNNLRCSSISNIIVVLLFHTATEDFDLSFLFGLVLLLGPFINLIGQSQDKDFIAGDEYLQGLQIAMACAHISVTVVLTVLAQFRRNPNSTKWLAWLLNTPTSTNAARRYRFCETKRACPISDPVVGPMAPPTIKFENAVLRWSLPQLDSNGACYTCTGELDLTGEITASIPFYRSGGAERQWSFVSNGAKLVEKSQGIFVREQTEEEKQQQQSEKLSFRDVLENVRSFFVELREQVRSCSRSCVELWEQFWSFCKHIFPPSDARINLNSLAPDSLDNEEVLL